MKIKFKNTAGNQFASKYLLPVKHSERTLTPKDVGMIYVGICIDITIFAVVVSYWPEMSVMAIMMASLIGYMIVSYMIALSGDIGLTYGITYSVAVRASFGYMGTHVPGILRMFPCWFWLGFTTWISAYSMDNIVYIFTGFSNLWLMLIIFTIMQCLNTALGLKAMARFDWLSLPILTVAIAIITGGMLNHYDANFLEVLATPNPDAINEPAAFSSCIIAMAGGFITHSLTTMDFTRNMKVPEDFHKRNWFSRNWKVLVGAIAGMVFINMILSLVGMVAGILTGTWNPIDYAMEVFTDNRVILVFCFLALIFASWSTNMTANITPAANILSNINPKIITFATGCFVAGAMSLILLPWEWADEMGIVQVFIGNMLGPVFFIIISDYYLVRKRKYNVPDLYNPNGQYKYSKNFNPAAIITLIGAFAISLIFDIRIAFWLQIPFSLFCYYFLMKYWIIKKYPQAEIEDPNYTPNYDYDGSDLGIDFSHEDAVN